MIGKVLTLAAVCGGIWYFAKPIYEQSRKRRLALELVGLLDLAIKMTAGSAYNFLAEYLKDCRRLVKQNDIRGCREMLGNAMNALSPADMYYMLLKNCYKMCGSIERMEV